MTEPSSVLLARHTHWPTRLQQALLASPAGRGWLAHNQHPDPEVTRDLAATADVEELLALLGAQRGTLPGLAALAHRAAQLTTGPEASAVTTERIDRALADALTGAGSAADARAAAAALPEQLPLGTETAKVLLALGVHTDRALTGAHRYARVLWLTADAQDHLSDAQAWEISRPTGEPDVDPGTIVEGLTHLMLRRPALAERDDEGDKLTIWAQSFHAWLRKRPDILALTTGDADARANAREALLSAAHTWDRADPTGRVVMLTGPLVLAHVAQLPGWTPRQREHLLGLMSGEWRDELANLTPWVARSLGGTAEVAPSSWLALTWESLRAAQGPLPVTDVELDKMSARLDVHGRVHDLTLSQVRAAGTYLLGALAHADPAVEAARWGVALRLADSFTGTLPELAEVAPELTLTR